MQGNNNLEHVKIFCQKKIGWQKKKIGWLWIINFYSKNHASVFTCSWAALSLQSKIFRTLSISNLNGQWAQNQKKLWVRNGDFDPLLKVQRYRVLPYWSEGTEHNPGAMSKRSAPRFHKCVVLSGKSVSKSGSFSNKPDNFYNSVWAEDTHAHTSERGIRMLIYAMYAWQVLHVRLFEA